MLMAYLIKGGAQQLLDQRGEVAPYALRLEGAEAAPKIHFPQDSHSTANFDELFELAAQWLRLDADGIEIVGVALISMLENDADAEAAAVGAQLETPSGSIFLFYPCTRHGQRLQIGEFEVLEGLLVPEGIRWRLPH